MLLTRNADDDEDDGAYEHRPTNRSSHRTALLRVGKRNGVFALPGKRGVDALQVGLLKV